MEEYIKNKISFKSIKEYYVKEKADLKNNTIRLIGSNYDKRKILLNKFVNKEIEELYIKITSTTSDDYFIRKVRDVSMWDEFYIITWYPKFEYQEFKE